MNETGLKKLWVNQAYALGGCLKRKMNPSDGRSRESFGEGPGIGAGGSSGASDVETRPSRIKSGGVEPQRARTQGCRASVPGACCDFAWM